jgi:long-subunit fatty acid transport protein
VKIINFFGFRVDKFEKNEYIRNPARSFLPEPGLHYSFWVTSFFINLFDMMKHFLLSFLVLVSGAEAVVSQDNHYWSQQFGAVSTLMGGAVIAGVRDNSAAFYNPGAISFIENPNLSVDGNVYKLDKINMNDGAGSGINLNSAQVNIYPQILSGMIDYLKIPRVKFCYSILTRNFTNILMSSRYSRSVPGSSGTEPEKYLGEFDFINQVNEQWFGVSGSYRVNDKLGLGVTLFCTYRGQTSDISHNTREAYLTDTLSSLLVSNSAEKIKYMALGFLAKIGLAWETGRWRFGFSFTTPSVGIYGNGSARREETGYTPGSATGVSDNTYMVMAENTSSHARYYHPLAGGIGIEYHSPKTRIDVSTEYYSAINSYYIMKPGNDAFVYPSSLKDSAGMSGKIERFLYVGNAARPVLNVGLGYDQAIGKKFSLILGAHTDYSSYTPPDEADELIPQTGYWDLYYVSTGVSYHTMKQTLTLGFSYAFSPIKEIDPVVIISPGNEMTSRAQVFAQSFGVVLGYTYYFKR